MDNNNIINKNYSLLLSIVINNNIKEYNNYNNDKGFFLIWRNKFLLKNIINHKRLYQINYKISFSNSHELSEYKYKEYIAHLVLSGKNIDIEKDNLILSDYPLPNTISILELNSNKKFNTIYVNGKYNQVIPQSVTVLKFGGEFNKLIEPGDLPNSLVEIDFGEKFNQPFKKTGVIPNSVKRIKFGAFNQKLKENDIPNSVTQIEFGVGFNRSLKQLPLSIQNIIFSDRYAKPIDSNQLPQSIEKIEGFYPRAAQLTYNIPSLVTSLSFDENFKKTIRPNLFPSNLTDLKFNNLVKQPFSENDLPRSLKSLHFGCDYNYPLGKDALPNGLTKLSAGFLFNQPLNFLPSSLISLKLSLHPDQNIKEGDLPNDLKSLEFYHCYSQPIFKGLFPPSLTSLDFGFSRWNGIIESGTLPNSITFLKFSHKFNSKLEKGSIPSSVKELHLGGLQSIGGPGIIPNSVENLVLCEFNENLKVGEIPSSVKYLLFIRLSNFPISPKVLPNSILKLSIWGQYNHQLQINTIPSSVKYLEILCYNKPIQQNVLPKGLEILKLQRYNIQFGKNILPKSLFYLNLDSYTYKINNDIIPSSLIFISLNYNIFLTSDALNQN